jgi:hypothetical protein
MVSHWLVSDLHVQPNAANNRDANLVSHLVVSSSVFFDQYGDRLALPCSALSISSLSASALCSSRSASFSGFRSIWAIRVYGMAIALFGIIVSTGLGSLCSYRLSLLTGLRLQLWASALGLYLIFLPYWFPVLMDQFAAGGLLVRAVVSLTAIVPSGLLMGFGFPTGMEIVNAIDSRPTPWFWAVNGAAGVLAAGVASASTPRLARRFGAELPVICCLRQLRLTWHDSESGWPNPYLGRTCTG